MLVRYLGHSCFQWILENGTILVADPYTRVGYEMPLGLRADIVTLSHEHFDHNYVDGVKGVQRVVRGIGEGEISDIRILGIETYHDEKCGALRGKNIVYKFWVEGICFCHLGDIGEPCSDALLEKIGRVDVLMIPVGGTYTIDAIGAAEYVRKIAPKTVIPMHFKPEDGALDIQGLDGFLRLFVQEDVVAVDGECKMTKETLADYEGKILVMNRVKRV